MTIYLKDIWPISNQTDYKVHFARWNGVQQPLEAWICFLTRKSCFLLESLWH